MGGWRELELELEHSTFLVAKPPARGPVYTAAVRTLSPAKGSGCHALSRRLGFPDAFCRATVC